jgi:hypoxanthine-DNA glycosylase
MSSAFWWIAGDCLGFRRASGISSSTGKPFKLSSALRHDNIVPYESQLEIMCSHGFAMWDVIMSCKREGSLDQDIQEDVANDIEGFCRAHPSIRRIVLANGGTGCQFFKKHFKTWLDSGELVPSSHPASQQAFKKWTRNTGKEESGIIRQITCISALAVSPAAAKYTYEEKRAFWEESVYAPGLEDFRIRMQQEQIRDPEP